jgi:two-component system KDP operon response regulator KdpE
MTDDPKKVLVVDDEAQITRVLLRGLESAGYQVRIATDGRAGLETFRSWLPDLVITDLSMPGYTGLELCERIRQLSEVPVLVLSVKEDEPTKVKAFDLGADDYVAKPFGMAELTARVRALLRRTAAQPQSDAAYEAGDFKIDPQQRLVEVNGKAVHLTPKVRPDPVLPFQRGSADPSPPSLPSGAATAEQPEYLRVFIANLQTGAEPAYFVHIKTSGLATALTRIGFLFSFC